MTTTQWTSWPARRAARSETGIVITIAAGVVTAGVVVQQWQPPGPRLLVVTTVACALGLVATGLLVRGKVLAALAGFRLAAVVLFALGAGAAAGTLILQGKPASFYQEAYGGFGRVIVALALDDLFHSAWFGGLLGLTVAGLVLSVLLRWPLGWKNLGFFVVHLGIIVTLLGAAGSALLAEKGRVDLRVGRAPASTVALTARGEPTGETAALGGTVALEQFDVDRYRERLRVTLYERREAGAQLVASFEPVSGLTNRLPDGATFVIEAYYPELVVREQLVPARGPAPPGLHLSVGGRDEWLLAGHRARVDGPGVTVLFGRTPPSFALAASEHALAAAGGAQVAVRLDEPVELPGAGVVTPLRFFPHFTYDLEKRAAENLSDDPVNPALEVQLADGARRWLFAKVPDYDHGGPATLTYVYAPAPAGVVLAVGAEERTVLVRRGGAESQEPLVEGLELAGVRFGALVPAGTVERVAATASQEPRRPAVRVRVRDAGGERVGLLVAGRYDQLEAAGRLLTFEERGDEVKAFRSHVRVTEDGVARAAEIGVNSPLAVGGWLLYQTNYDPKDPSYSGLEAVRDPGANAVFLGFGLLFFGVVYMIYVQPRLRRREA